MKTDSVQEEWRRNGLRLQLVSRWILPRFGYTVLKGQEDSIPPKLYRRINKLTAYLKDYADYIVSKKGRIAVVDVKAPVWIRVRGISQRFGSTAIQFRKREWLEYCDSPVPVRILLWEYDGSKSLTRQRGPIRYAVLGFRSLKTLEELPEHVKALAGSESHPRRLMPKTLRSLLQKSNALDVQDIQPGRIVYGESL